MHNKVEAIRGLFSFDVKDNDVAFIFLGYSGILLRSENFAIAIDPGKSLDQPEVSAIKQLDLLLFSHSHWDHYKKGYALAIFRQTRPHVVAGVVSSAELKAHIPPSMLTTADPAARSATYQIGETEVTALPGIHVGPITQYLIKLGGIKIFHGGDSGYWRQKATSTDLAFVPVGTATTCSPATALATIMNLQPRKAVPIHGRKQAMNQFKNIMEKVLPDVEVVVPDKFEPIRLSF